MHKNLVLLLMVSFIGCQLDTSSNKKNVEEIPTELEEEGLQMTHFTVIDERDIEFCFNENVKGNWFNIKIVTPSGKSIVRESLLTQPKKDCYTSQKMQLSFRAYDETETSFYEDSIVNENIHYVEWLLFKEDYTDPFAQGKFAVK